MKNRKHFPFARTLTPIMFLGMLEPDLVGDQFIAIFFHLYSWCWKRREIDSGIRSLKSQCACPCWVRSATEIFFWDMERGRHAFEFLCKFMALEGDTWFDHIRQEHALLIWTSLSVQLLSHHVSLYRRAFISGDVNHLFCWWPINYMCQLHTMNEVPWDLLRWLVGPTNP